jgi:hypothetical protein
MVGIKEIVRRRSEEVGVYCKREVGMRIRIRVMNGEGAEG